MNVGKNVVKIIFCSLIFVTHNNTVYIFQEHIITIIFDTFMISKDLMII